MVKLIKGALWFCCPQCGKKLNEVEPWATCTGVKTFCKVCKWAGFIDLEGAKTNGKRKENTG